MTPELTIYALWVAWLVSWTVAMLWSNRTEKRDVIGAELIFRVFFYLGVILLFALPLAPPYYAQTQLWHFGDTMNWILAGLTAAGVLFTWWARIHLGRLWSDWVVKRPVTMSSTQGLIGWCAIRSIRASSSRRSQPRSRKEHHSRCLAAPL